MSTYVIGDIHGCYKTFKELIRQFKFNINNDKLILLGDLISKGNDSLKTLRFIKKLKNNAIIILGNHELNLLNAYYNITNANIIDNNIKIILKAKDIHKLISWLIKGSLIHEEGDFIFVHAGILPYWTINMAFMYAKKAEFYLKNNKIFNILNYLEKANKWSNNISEYKKIATIINIFTKLRFLNKKNLNFLNFSCKDSPKNFNKKLTAWFSNIKLKKNKTIIFGHWSSFGFYNNGINFISLDSGCVYGKKLTAMRLEDKKFFFQKNLEN